MSVATDFRVDVRPYTAYENPSLPIAAWISQAGIVGDATGGTVVMRFHFQVNPPAVTELYSLEQISADTSSNTGRSGVLQTENMDSLARNRDASPQKWVFQTVASGISGTSAVRLDDRTQLPLWLGAPTPDQEGNAGLRMTWGNVDLLLYAVTLQGYVWGPRSVMALGGPRRPVGGLFGNG